VGYYFKDEQLQDQVVEVRAALEMVKELGTPEAQKRKMAFPDAGAHVLACDLVSGAVDQVRDATYAFAEEVLKMKPVK
jgi:hypothetical protein